MQKIKILINTYATKIAVAFLNIYMKKQAKK